ncbi:hypothetical protein J1N35_025326 [Gossypium stocksii]|uniref:Uncharacterized protein n=1 Tax=Gossypium stocksii TaxID=47602 RepID=A0A9D3V7G2_9ROSI|nr:hypothetical protein J1N35_025326 [Gossypium stocksii]
MCVYLGVESQCCSPALSSDDPKVGIEALTRVVREVLEKVFEASLERIGEMVQGGFSNGASAPFYEHCKKHLPGNCWKMLGECLEYGYTGHRIRYCPWLFRDNIMYFRYWLRFLYFSCFGAGLGIPDVSDRYVLNGLSKIS